MLNARAATDARHSRSGKDAMLYNESRARSIRIMTLSGRGS